MACKVFNGIAAGPPAPPGGAPNGGTHPAQAAEPVVIYQDWQLSNQEWLAISQELAWQVLWFNLGGQQWEVTAEGLEVEACNHFCMVIQPLWYLYGD